MQVIVKDDINTIIKKHDFVTGQEKLSKLELLIDDYIELSRQLLPEYMKLNNLCFARDVNGESKRSVELATACFVAIIFDIEYNRKINSGSSLSGSGNRISSHSAGAYSQSYESMSSEFFDSIANTPLAVFLKSALVKCPEGLGVAWISTCGEEPNKPTTKSCT